ncbi:MAG TPA: hypothetical protein VJH55_00350 [Candidatus Paceibacterota bacterium]
MKKISYYIIALFVFISVALAQTTLPVPATPPSVLPIPAVPVMDPPFNPGPVIGNLPRAQDHHSWVIPLADLLSYAKQAVRKVSGYVNSKTVLPSSRQQSFEVDFMPRPDGVVMAEDINKALASHKFDVLVAQSEEGFSGNINLSDSAYETLFNGWFWVDATMSGDQKIKVSYYLTEEISLPVPSDMTSVKISTKNEYGVGETFYASPTRGRIRIPTSLGNQGNAQAWFTDGTVINFNLSNGLAESEKRVTAQVSGEFANSFTFPKGSTTIVLGLEEWMLNNQGEYVATFEPSSSQLILYAEVLQGKAARSVRLRQLPNGWTINPTAITPGKALNLQLPPGALGVWEATFTFERERYHDDGHGRG